MQKILSLTYNQMISKTDTEIVSLLNEDLNELHKYPKEYGLSLASSMIKKIMSIKTNNQYSKFYQVVTSSTFKDDNLIYLSLDKNNLNNLKELFSIYDEKKEYIDYLFLSKEVLFDELILSNKFKVIDFLSDDVTSKFTKESYRNILSFVFKGDDKGKVVRALLRSKNKQFIDVISIMDKEILTYVKDDLNFFDTVLTLLNYNNYRRLIWDYYNEYINKKKIDKDKKNIRVLIYYSFSLMNNKYSNNKIPVIENSMESLIKDFESDKDQLHTMFFGQTGYMRVKSNNFNRLEDWPDMNDDNQLLFLKIAFFYNIYGVTYKEVEKILKVYKDYNKKYDYKVREQREIFETIIAMKSLYELELENEDKIKLYRDIYFRNIKKLGIYTPVNIKASMLMLSLLKEVDNANTEII